MKLFACYLGGKTATSLIELHDVRFAVGATIEDCHDSLRRQWWGDLNGLHIDSYAALEQVDGYDITLKTEPAQGTLKLYFLNMGGYRPNEFTEQHLNVFVVAESEATAKEKAKAQIMEWHLPHKDRLSDVDAIVSVNELLGGMHIHLTKAQVIKPLNFTCDYLLIDKIAA